MARCRDRERHNGPIRLTARRFGLGGDMIPAGILIGESLADGVILPASLAGRKPMLRGDRRRLFHAFDHVIRHALPLTRPREAVSLDLTVGPGGIAER